MNRRRYLALLGATALAGCSEGQSQPDPSNTPATTTEEWRQQPLDVTPTSTPPDTPTETATPAETPEPTETTPTDEELAREHIRTAEGELTEGVSAWDEQAGESGDMMSVNAESDEFDPAPVWDAARDVTEELKAAEEYAIESLQPLITAVRAERELLRVTARFQAETINIQEDTEFAIDRFSADDIDGFRYIQTRYPNIIQGFVDTSTLEGLLEGATAVDRALAAPYQAKIDQLEREERVYNSFENWFGAGDQAWRRLIDAHDQVEAGDYNTAQLTAEDAEEDFEAIQDEVEDGDPGTLGATVSMWKDALASKAAVARNVRKEAAAAADAE